MFNKTILIIVHFLQIVNRPHYDGTGALPYQYCFLFCGHINFILIKKGVNNVQPTTSKGTNRLIHEKSPYLLQHAYNPVDWYPWGKDAFEKAKGEDKPIFLSIGYSTCHWCHVMERESFEDREVAEVLNNYYVSIKVDREERSDIDSIYMSACQAITGQGGWPLTVIMTPDKIPFFAGTYFPKTKKYGHPGLMDLLLQIKTAWDTERARLVRIGNDVVEMIKHSPEGAKDETLDEKTPDNAFRNLQSSFDRSYGGFSGAPKFPMPHNIMFLLRYWKAKGEHRALQMAETTLKGMYKGGIFDHIGFGFSRYSVDDKWLVPHFEKMLYDNALLAMAYTEAYQATGNRLYKDIAQKIFTYVMRDMTSSEGGFYSAEDADSEGEEGKFYVWTPEEIKAIVGEDNGRLFCKHYDIKPGGNFEGKNIPNLIYTNLEELQRNEPLMSKLEAIRQTLFVYREQRHRPHRDDKILTPWNGLMIAAFALGGRAFNENKYIKIAEKALEFIEQNLLGTDGRLLARYRDGEAALLAYLDDYAFLILGLLELYRSTFKTDYLQRALELNEDMLGIFGDDDSGGLYLYGHDSEQLITRPKEAYDGAIPSGNSVALYNISRLFRLTGDANLKHKAEGLINAFGGEVSRNPMGYTFFISALMFHEGPTKEIVLTARSRAHAGDMLEKINEGFMPFATVLLNTKPNNLDKIAPFTKEQKMLEGKPTAYVCENFACLRPTTDSDILSGILLS